MVQLRGSNSGLALQNPMDSSKNHDIFLHKCQKSIFIFFGCCKLYLITRFSRIFHYIDFFDTKKFAQSSQAFAHFFEHQASKGFKYTKICIFLPTSTDRTSSPRWSCVMFEHTRTMYSSRYVDSRYRKCSIINLGAPNRAWKLIEFGQNPRSGACTTLTL